MVLKERELKEIGIQGYGLISTEEIPFDPVNLQEQHLLIVRKDLGLPSGSGTGGGMPGTMPCA